MVYTDPIKENHSRRRTRQRASLFFIGAKDAGTINENYLHKKCKKLLQNPLQSVIIGKGKGRRPNRRAQQWRQSRFTTGRR
jgi:hypothetical protein